MNYATIMQLGKDTIVTVILIGGPMLVVGAVIGVLVSMIQTVTQLKDQSLTFIPKIVGVLAVLLLATPFITKTITGFTFRIFDLAAKLGHIY